MFKALCIIAVTSLTGCATYSSDPDLFVTANQTQTLIQAFTGPNKVSGGIIEGQNYYRNVNATFNNPWNGFFTLRNLWLR